MPSRPLRRSLVSASYTASTSLPSTVTPGDAVGRGPVGDLRDPHHFVDGVSRPRRGCSRRRRPPAGPRWPPCSRPRGTRPVGGAVAEEAGDDAAGLAHLERQRHPRRQRDAAAHDRDRRAPCPCPTSPTCIEPPLPLQQPVVLANSSAIRLFERKPPRQRMPVRPVRAGDHVLRLERRADTPTAQASWPWPGESCRASCLPGRGNRRALRTSGTQAFAGTELCVSRRSASTPIQAQ